MKKTITYLFTGFLFFTTLAMASTTLPWPTWKQQLKQEAVNDGIDPQFFDQIFRHITPQKRVINFDRRQPERRLTFLKYRNTRADAFRIKLGVREMRKHYNLLQAIGDEYGVDPCFIVSLWGIESSYGRYMGNFPVIRALATLAYDKRRSDFFRKELLLALHIVQGRHVPLSRFKGEWAGGSGHPQFLPSSWHRFAVDYDQDGRKDIWTTLPDVFASIANYLASNGWQTGGPWAIPVAAPSDIPESWYGYKTLKKVSEWQALGVRIKPGFTLPQTDLEAHLIKPYGGPAMLAFKNFRVIMRYNNSTFYAGTVGYMVDKICRR